MDNIKKRTAEALDDKCNTELSAKRVKDNTFRESLDLKNNYDKIIELLQREFQNEVYNKQKELQEIQHRLLKARKTLHLLRYVVIKSFYDRKELQIANNDESFNNQSNCSHDKDASVDSQTRIHPAVKKLLGKKPVNYEPYRPRTRTPNTILTSTIKLESIDSNNTSGEVTIKLENKCESNGSNESAICMASSHKFPTRNREKNKHQIVVGNVSKFLAASSAQDNSTHKWMVYVRGPRVGPDISHIVKKIRFFLHPSYQPNDIVDIEEPPFHLSRRGWGEFPLRVQIHFNYSTNKPVDVIHNLKLDRTYTGRQTLGNETIIDVWLYDNNSSEPLNALNKIQEQTDRGIFDNCEVNTNIPIDHANYFMKYVKEETISPNDDPTVDIDNSLIYSNNEICTGNEVSDVITEIVCDDLHLVLTQNKREIEQPTHVLVKDGKNYIISGLKQNVSLLKYALANSMSAHLSGIDDTDSTYLEDHCYTRHILENDFEQDQSNVVIDMEKYKICLPYQKFSSVVQILFCLLKHLPLVTELVEDYNYRCCYPYAAADLEEFSSWHPAKRHCSEWFRAKHIKRILEENNVSGHEEWSVKTIMMYGRAHAFTPLATDRIFRKHSESGKTVPAHIRLADVSSTRTQHAPLDILTHGACVVRLDCDECIVDVEDMLQQPGSALSNETLQPDEDGVVPHEEDVLPCAYVRQSARSIGINLCAEETEPGVRYNLSERVLVQAIKCLAEELIRKAIACNVINYSGRNEDGNIGRNDIFNVLLTRPEFDIFLNVGLGKEIP